MQITIIGSGFVTTPIFQEALRDVFPDAQWVTGEVPWPAEPVRAGNDEIYEFSGAPEYVAELSRDAEVLVTDVAPVTEAVFATAPKLRAVGIARGGPVNVNLAAARAYHVPVVNAPGRNAAAAAEFTVGLLLATARRIARGHQELTQGRWDGRLYLLDESGIELDGRQAGLIGLGHVGAHVARILNGFGMRVVAYDPILDDATLARHHVTPMALETLLETSDVISLHARLTADTYHLINNQALHHVRSDAILINTARGGLIDYSALFDAVRDGRLAGVGLDVFDPEPPEPDNPLLHHPRVVVTPHIGGATRESAIRGARLVAEDLGRLMRGEPPQHCVNPEVLA